MQIKSRLLILFILAALLAFAPGVLAQEDTFGLSGDDYALFTAANEASSLAAADSLGFNFTVEFTSADGSANLSGTGVTGMDANGAPLALITINGSGTSEGEETPVNIEARIVGDMIYVNDLTGTNGWEGAQLEDLLTGVAGASGVPLDPADLMSGDPGAVAGGADMGQMMEAMDGLMTSGFITMSRAGNENVNGVDTARFTTSIDLTKLVESEAFGAIFMMAAGMGAAEGAEVDSAEMMQQIQMMQPMLVSMVQGINITFDQYISTADNLIQRGALNLDVSIPSLTGEGEPMTLGLAVTIDITDYDPVVDVTAPESFTEVEM